MIVNKSTWTEFKNIINNKNLLIQYEDSDSYYYLFALDENIEYCYLMSKDNGADQIDFENNYKNDANKKVSYLRETTITSDGSKKRLDVEIQQPISVIARLEDAVDTGNAFAITTGEQLYSDAGTYWLFQLKNPASSGRYVKIIDVIISTAGAANNTLTYYKNATPSVNGIELTAYNLNFASSNTPVAIAFRKPTMSGGTILFGNVSVDDKHSGIGRSFFENYGMILDEGDIFSISTSNLKNIPVWLTVKWVEVNI